MPFATPKEGLPGTSVTSAEKFPLSWLEAAAVWDCEGRVRKALEVWITKVCLTR